MSSLDFTCVPTGTFTANDIMDPDKVLDLGAYKQVNIIVVIHKAGTNGNILFEQAAENAPGFWVAIAGATVDVTSTGPHFISITAFCRYLRWRCDNNVAGDPVISAKGVAKE